MRKVVDGRDSNGALLAPGRSVVRYADTEWMFHFALYSKERDTVNLVLSSMKTDKTVVLHNRDLTYDGVYLVRTNPEE